MTQLWACIIGLIMFLPSLIRDFKHMSYIGLLASSTMFVCTILVITGHGVQDFPNGYTPDTPVTFTVWAPEGTTFVQGMNVSHALTQNCSPSDCTSDMVLLA